MHRKVSSGGCRSKRVPTPLSEIEANIFQRLEAPIWSYHTQTKFAHVWITSAVQSFHFMILVWQIFLVQIFNFLTSVTIPIPCGNNHIYSLSQKKQQSYFVEYLYTCYLSTIVKARKYPFWVFLSSRPLFLFKSSSVLCSRYKPLCRY